MGFVFSSRRRHTRWPRDWSSDVCSSDLPYNRTVKELAAEEGVSAATIYNWRKQARKRGQLLPNTSGTPDRSEERRVGKECRSRGVAGPDKIMARGGRSE